MPSCLRRAALNVIPALALAGCGGLQAYEGERLPPAQRALVRADPAFSAGLPVQVLLRKVDDVAVPATRSAVELRPGPHVFVADCRLAETGSSTRFVIEAEVAAGAEYRLVPRATAVACQGISLERR